MKRWTILIGRGGTILIAIGCATLLVSLIPSATVGSFRSSGGLREKTWEMHYQGVLSPQQGISINITVNGTLNVYLLEVSFRTIYEWISETYPQLPGNGPLQVWNETYLKEFVEANPQTVAVEREISSGGITFEYTPTKMTNFSLVLGNPNPDFVEVNLEGYVFLVIAPKVKMQTLSQITIPVGLVLTMPWITNSLKNRKGETRAT